MTISFDELWKMKVHMKGVSFSQLLKDKNVLQEQISKLDQRHCQLCKDKIEELVAKLGVVYDAIGATPKDERFTE